MPKLPTSTYRLQFNKKFNFNSARKLIPYFKELGISHIYASPVFKASKGSVHGYDVVDPTQLNPELGKTGDFDRLISEARENNIYWMQDIVPNHMSFDFENKMLVDLLENGPESRFCNYFDVEWNFGHSGDKPRMLAPFLGKYYQESLEGGEILLDYDKNGFSINYYENKFPVRISSYSDILSSGFKKFQNKAGTNYPAVIKLLGLLHLIKLPSYENNDDRYHQIKFIKALLWELYSGDEQVRVYVNETIKRYNGIKGNPESYDFMDKLLSDQYFKLSYWKVANEEINYRRFFNINTLISLKVENEEVFNRTHSLIFKLLKEEKIDGLRVDHIDGLYDPEVYLKRIREKIGDRYLIVEKILETDEQLPSSWPVDGTTGYDFLNLVNGLFCKTENENKFNQIYTTFTRSTYSFENLVVDKKKLIIRTRMAGELERLSLLVDEIAKQDRYGADITLNGIKTALEEILVHFPIYRTYVNGKRIAKPEADYINRTIGELKYENPRIEHEINYIGMLLTLQHDKLSEELYDKSVNFILRFQQLTGPLMAKGFEDTALYIYNRLISLNEVGGNPSKFGFTLQEFHKKVRQRGIKWKFSLNSTSTHDTKRGEDVRARINVLSEIPDEWNKRIKKWQNINKKYKNDFAGQLFPDNNDEYFLYQTLIGALPFDYAVNWDEFLERIKNYAIKVVREAKVYTAWVKPDETYENAFLNFIDNILTESDYNLFLKDLREFQKYISYYGVLNSLSQTLIKMTAPGIPDFYQGSELWDLNLVDPDNRRPVNFKKRRGILAVIEEKRKKSNNDLFRYLFSYPENGALKLFLIQRILKARKKYTDLFEEGNYSRLNTVGKFKDNVISYLRRNEKEFFVAIAVRYLTDLVKENELPLKDVWENTSIFIPFETGNLTNLITSETLKIRGNIRIGEILSEFPVALLKGDITG
ncbi:MAG TPA: malto-oligosyltrehalose synthase [Ignavibacteriaceae bacterium]|nr:malto-oligosyltrehalose synthase [Ignavibacteriaceae bacterium]